MPGTTGEDWVLVPALSKRGNVGGSGFSKQHHR